MKKVFSILMMALICFSVLGGHNLRLEWDPSMDNSVTGYKIYYSTNNFSGGSPSVIDAGANITCLITNVIEGMTYTIYATAYNAVGLESDPSNIVEYTVPYGWTTNVPSKTMEFKISQVITN